MADGKFTVLPRKGIDSDPDLIGRKSVIDLLNYVNNKDANIGNVKALIKKINRELGTLNKRLYIKKAHSQDKDAENRIYIYTK